MTNKPTPRVANCSGELWVLDELGNPKYKPDLHNSNAIDKIVIAANAYDSNQERIAEQAAEIARYKEAIEGTLDCIDKLKARVEILSSRVNETEPFHSGMGRYLDFCINNASDALRTKER